MPTTGQKATQPNLCDDLAQGLRAFEGTAEEEERLALIFYRSKVEAFLTKTPNRRIYEAVPQMVEALQALDQLSLDLFNSAVGEVSVVQAKSIRHFAGKFRKLALSALSAAGVKPKTRRYIRD